MTLQMSLANQLLVAMPSQQDAVFAQSVIYVCDYHSLGTVGLMINKPTDYSVKILFEHLNLDAPSEEINNQPLMFGGPVQPERGFVIHRPFGNWRSSLKLCEDDVTITTSNDIIEAIVLGNGPKDSLVTLGYSGWDSSQLEQEIIDDLWLVCPFKAELLYDVPFKDRWKETALTIGVHMDQLISGGGHA
ncbi:MAG: YqgE/AlgH family protein [Legionellaceae bacterium]|nr:YqgE/AlgH family protein [Legionellaceae bacterium]